MKNRKNTAALWALICAVIPLVLAVVFAVTAGVFITRTGNWAILILAVLVWSGIVAAGGALAVGLGIAGLRREGRRGCALAAVPVGLVELVTGAVTLITLLN